MVKKSDYQALLKENQRLKHDILRSRYRDAIAGIKDHSKREEYLLPRNMLGVADICICSQCEIWAKDIKNYVASVQGEAQGD